MANSPPCITSIKEGLSAAAVLARHLTFGGVIDPGVGPKLLCEGVWNSDSRSSHGNATVETARLGLTREISFEIEFFFSGRTHYFQRLATCRKNKSSLTWK